MRLAATVKYLSSKKLNNIILCITLFFFLFQQDLKSQNYTIAFDNIPLSEALIQVSDQLNIKFAFDAGKTKEVIINREIKGNTSEELISGLLLETPYEYKYRYGRYLIVEKEKGLTVSIPSACQITGSITDAETGENLPYANIILLDNNLLTSATESGSFCLKNTTANPVHLLVSYIGYDQLDTTFNWKDPTLNLDIRLIRRPHVLDTIVVKSSRLEMVDLRNDVDFATTIDPARLIDLPLLAETDVFRMLQLLPGISYTENSSGLSIRGGSSDQNLVLFDGQTLYNLSHYYGIVSALNPNVIKDLQIYKGGYDSRFGERVSGIVDITGKSGNNMKPRVYGDINLLSGNITAELPLSRKLTMIAAMRRSYSDIYATGFSDGLFERNMDLFRGDSSNIVIQTKPKFYFFDYNAKITYKIRNLENLSISIYGGKDYFNNTFSGNSGSLFIEETDLNVWSNYGISSSWQKQWDESFFSNLQIGTSGYSNTYTKNTTIDRTQSPDTSRIFLPDPVNAFNTFDQNELDDIYFTLRNTYKLSNNNQLNFGILTRRNTIYYHKDADKVYVYDNTYQSGWTSSAYIQDRISLSDKLTLKPGIRLSYFDGKKKFCLEPRFSINYKPSESLSLRLATGRYYQFISQVMAQQETGYNKNFWIMADDSLHHEVASNHFIIGMTAEKGKLLFDAEAYYKSFSGLQEYVFISPFRKNSDFHDIFKPPDPDQPDHIPPSFFVTGRGRSYGVDLMLKYRGSVYTSWLSYSWGRSLHNFRDINNDQSIPAPNDLPHQLSWTNMVSVGKWNFGSVTLFSSGKPYIDFTESSMNLPFTRVYKRLPDYFRCDLSANYNFSIRKSSFKTGITFINIFNTQNYFDINTNKFDFDNTTFSEITLIQSQSFSVNLFLHFAF